MWANGGYVTKHSFGVYGTRPPANGFRHGEPQAEVDAGPQRELAPPADAAGPAVIEAYTVMHDREGRPDLAFTSCLLDDGRRAWGTSADGDTVSALCAGEWVGRPVALDADGTVRL